MTARSVAWRVTSFVLLGAAVLGVGVGRAEAAAARQETITASEERSLAEWDKRVTRMIRMGELKLREEHRSDDGTRRDQWFEQLHKGVPIVGAEVWRQLDGRKTIALEGTIYVDVDVNPVPKLTRAEALIAFQALATGGPGPSLLPQLAVLPGSDGTCRLVYRARVYSGTELTLYSLDASTGAEVAKEVEPNAPQN
jgi:hypothetical protein